VGSLSSLPSLLLTLQPELVTGVNCNNKVNYSFENKKGKSCKSFATSEQRCKKEDFERGYKPVSYYCPRQCNIACGGGWRDVCENVKKYQLDGKKCTQLAKDGECQKKDILNDQKVKTVEFFCPEECNTACFTNAPSDAPMNKPSDEPTNAPSVEVIAVENNDAAFVSVGEGYCRDANGELSTNWSGGELLYKLYDTDLSDCQANCKETSSEAGQAGCVGIYFTQNPFEICVLYLSLETPVVPVETSSGAADYGTCYQYLSDTNIVPVAAPTIPDPTPAPGDGCVVKTEKKYGLDCADLNETKCPLERLCEWEVNKKYKCTHVCDEKKKKQCKKLTFQGKNICKFKK